MRRFRHSSDQCRFSPFGVKPNRRLDAFYSMTKTSLGENDMRNFFKAIARLFAPRPDDFGARLASHYGLD